MAVNYGLLSLLLTGGAMIIYQALIGGVPSLKPIFLFESMSSAMVFGQFEMLDHPIFTTMFSQGHQKNAPSHYYSRPREEKMVFFAIPGNMGGYI